ncbi:juvenile hormone esterase-like [Aricia agestis]|uniref:juvenile hormone esterase-like n=1 Tax=Aricia agestis TaxID=91739 RepID=UPI001C20BD39|nr:juvenile hormone esterase-like [Aricia agestis]
MVVHVFTVLVLGLAAAQAQPGRRCEAAARVAGGWLCGRTAFAGSTKYASFLGVPYARQPLGDLRFKELQAAPAWDGALDATAEGPACPQHDVLYGPLVGARNTSEACISANVHVPWEYLPPVTPPAFSSPYRTGQPDERAGLPVLVFVHGGGFAYGSGSTDFHGPDYLIDKNVIVITFNYRLNVFGFLSLGSAAVPGNNGLRDTVTLLQWVRDNARAFGGNPNAVTLAGQSAGAAIVHLLTLSPAAEGLFHRAIIMSGTAVPSFYTTSPMYAKLVAGLFTAALGINDTDPEEVHRRLVALPLDALMAANARVQDLIGVTAFMPVVEAEHGGVRRILDEDPETLLLRGRGSGVPLVIGHTSRECETFRPVFEAIDLMTRLKANPTLLLSPDLIYKTTPNVSLDLAKEVERRYFAGAPTMDEYLRACSDTYYVYPALKVADIRQRTGGAPAYLYDFSYESACGVIRSAFHLNFTGASHMEDLTFVFKPTAYRPSPPCTASAGPDYQLSECLTTIFNNFMYCGEPTCNQSHWPPVGGERLRYLAIDRPKSFRSSEVSREKLDMVAFFDALQPRAT